jgi:hypothetical protein
MEMVSRRSNPRGEVVRTLAVRTPKPTAAPRFPTRFFPPLAQNSEHSQPRTENPSEDLGLALIPTPASKTNPSAKPFPASNAKTRPGGAFHLPWPGFRTSKLLPVKRRMRRSQVDLNRVRVRAGLCQYGDRLQPLSITRVRTRNYRCSSAA